MEDRFGLGKKSAATGRVLRDSNSLDGEQRFAFGLGKRHPINQLDRRFEDFMKRRFSFGIGKRQALASDDRYAFGIGKK